MSAPQPESEGGRFPSGYALPGVYRHKKGGLYRVLGLAQHEGSGEQFVLYHPVEVAPEGIRYWVRPRADFDDVTDGVPRFQRIG